MPLLTIEIPWSPNITELGGFLLTWHGLFTAIGILAGVQLSLRMGRVVGYDPDNAYTLALVGVPSGIIGARLLFVVEHWDFYGSNIGEIFQINEGGISIWGGVLGGIIGGFGWALWRKYPIARGLDIAAFGLILGMAIGRLGDLVNGEHLARATDLPWGVLYTNPESPAFAHSLTVGAHHPATTYEMFGDLAILGLLFYVLFRLFRDRPGHAVHHLPRDLLGDALHGHVPAHRLGRGVRDAAARAAGRLGARDPRVPPGDLVHLPPPAPAVRGAIAARCRPATRAAGRCPPRRLADGIVIDARSGAVRRPRLSPVRRRHRTPRGVARHTSLHAARGRHPL